MIFLSLFKILYVNNINQKHINYIACRLFVICMIVKDVKNLEFDTEMDFCILESGGFFL